MFPTVKSTHEEFWFLKYHPYRKKNQAFHLDAINKGSLLFGKYASKKMKTTERFSTVKNITEESWLIIYFPYKR